MLFEGYGIMKRTMLFGFFLKLYREKEYYFFVVSIRYIVDFYVCYGGKKNVFSTAFLFFYCIFVYQCKCK